MRQVVLVAGPPGAGKSTYVAQRRQPGDVVLDQGLGPDAYRRGLLKVGQMSTGRAWVIRCSPGALARGALAKQVGATEVVVLAPPMPILLARAAATANSRRATAQVREWFRREAANRPPGGYPTPPTPRRTTVERGYGKEHKAARARLLPHAYGQLCPRCGHPMMPGQALDLDHTDDRRSYLGFSHASCNRRAGARKRNASAQVRGLRTSQRW